MECAQARQLLEAYTLGVLAAAEHTAVAQHALTCEACRTRLRDLSTALHTLPHSLSAAAPQTFPADVHERLWQRLEMALSPAGAAPALPTPLPSRWRLWRPMGAVAALLLLSLSLASNLHLLAQERGLRAHMAMLMDQQELVLEVVDSAHAIKRVLRPPDGRRGGNTPYGKLYTRPDMLHVVAMAARLPQPPADQAYYLWVGSQGHVQPVGSLTVNAQGFGLLVFDAAQPGEAYDAVQLTLQPLGSPYPPSPPILLWEAPK